MKNCGLDLGKKYSHFCVLGERRERLAEGRVRTRVADLEALFGGQERMRIVVEASTKAFFVADVLTELGHEVHVVDPGKTKAIGATQIKHDKLDARVLALLSHVDLLAEVDRPSAEVRVQRMSVVVREGLVRARASMVTTVRSLLDSEGIEVRPCSSKRFVAVVYDRPEGLPASLADVITPMLDAIEGLNERIAECDEAIGAVAKSDPTMKLLQTAPGVGPITAAAFVYTIRDPGRFRTGRDVSAYLGLVPSLYASGQTCRRGRITKRGSRQMRWLLTMAANALLRARRTSALQVWGRALAERVGRKKAVVAVARKLAMVLWAMWRRERGFEASLAAA